MSTVTDLKTIILLYLFVVLISPPVYSMVSNFVEPGMKSMVVTGAIAYMFFSIGLYFLLKNRFTHELFTIAYIIFLNIFPFVLFYGLGIGMIDYTQRTITDIINFIS